MTVSVAMATYNGGPYVAEQIRSVLRQTRPVDEIVVCDDGSSDETVQLVRRELEAFEGRVTVVVNEVNLGFKANFKKALSLCHGDLFLLCDQDDRWADHKVADTVAFFEAHKDALAVASSFSLIDGAGNALPDHGPKGTCNQGLVGYFVPENGSFKPDLVAILRRNLAPGCALAVRKELAHEFCRHSKSVLPHDWELCLVAAGKNALYFYNCVLMEYRLHENNVLGFKGEATDRAAIALQKATAMELLTAYLPVERQADFMRLRAGVLEDKRKGTYRRLLASPVYKQYFSLRERLGDLRYIWHK